MDGNGRPVKLCGGVLHLGDGNGTFVSVKDFSPVDTKRRPGLLRHTCRNCARVTIYGPASGYTSADLVLPVYLEIEKRIGRAEFARRMGINTSPIRKVVLGRGIKIRTRTAHKAVLLLAELRKNKEWYDARTIKHGAIARGREVRTDVTQIYPAGKLHQKAAKGKKHPLHRGFKDSVPKPYT